MPVISPTVDAFIFLAVSICVLVWVLQTTRAHRTGENREEGVRLVSRGRSMAALGLVLLLFSFYPNAGATDWRCVVIGCAAGGIVGAGLAGHRAGKWGEELERQGRLLPQTRRWWQSWRGALIFILLISPAFFLLPAGTTAAIVHLNQALGGLYDGLCAFFVISGMYIAVWAQEKERHGYRPLIIPIRRI